MSASLKMVSSMEEAYSPSPMEINTMDCSKMIVSRVWALIPLPTGMNMLERFLMIRSTERAHTVLLTEPNTSGNTKPGSRVVRASILMLMVVNTAVLLLMERRRGKVSESGVLKQNWRVTATSGHLNAIKWRGMALTAMPTAPHTSVISGTV